MYDAILLFGITFIASWVFTVLFGNATHGLLRGAYQVYLTLVAGIYFVYCWHHSGQTLAMKTWGVRVIGRAGHHLSVPLAALRYSLAFTGLLAAGVGFLWAIVDPDRQFLHDRLLGTRIVRAQTA